MDWGWTKDEPLKMMRLGKKKFFKKNMCYQGESEVRGKMWFEGEKGSRDNSNLKKGWGLREKWV
jgi:hypothetical protein